MVALKIRLPGLIFGRLLHPAHAENLPIPPQGANAPRIPSAHKAYDTLLKTKLVCGCKGPLLDDHPSMVAMGAVKTAVPPTSTKNIAGGFRA